jgi:hypothetical protein
MSGDTGRETHPEHFVFAGLTHSGVWTPAKPLRGSWWIQFKRERACRKSGGHWWHPESQNERYFREGLVLAITCWFCCQCGAERHGCPKDGE